MLKYLKKNTTRTTCNEPLCQKQQKNMGQLAVRTKSGFWRNTDMVHAKSVRDRINRSTRTTYITLANILNTLIFMISVILSLCVGIVIGNSMEDNTSSTLNDLNKNVIYGPYLELNKLPEAPERVVSVQDDSYTVEEVKTTTGAILTTVTAYTSEVGQTDSTPCIAADGTDICLRYAAGELICATNDHPFGTLLVVDGYGTCTVADRMNSRYTGTGRVDIYLGYDTPAAFQWGKRSVAVSPL